MNLCLCGCKKEVKEGNKYIHGHFSRVNNPMKGNHNPKPRIIYETRICICGCNEAYVCPVDSDRKYIHGHNIKGKRWTTGKHASNYIQQETRLCACDCNESFECPVNSKQKYIHGHNSRIKCNFKIKKGSEHPMSGKTKEHNPKYIRRETRICICECNRPFECKVNSSRKYFSKSCSAKIRWQDLKYREDMKLMRSKTVYPFKDTSIELAIQELLTILNIPFEKHRTLKSLGIGIGSKYQYHQVDIVLIEYKLIIECDGIYWHLGSEERDTEIDETIKRSTWNVVRFTDYEINTDIAKCKEIICSLCV